MSALVALTIATPVWAQGGAAVITGRVVSEHGQPLSGANVTIPELGISVVSSPGGSYTITVPAVRANSRATLLRARMIGFQPASRQISLTPGTQTANFELSTDITRLSEVVVTGVTSATEQIKVPFTVARIDTSQMPVAGANPISQLQGKIPGATIVGSGRPGSQPAVVLRGPVSMNAVGRTQQPLYLIDGVVLQGGLPDINASDIESVEIVKGAAAASLYGARAGAGVINMTTKSGRNAPPGMRFGVRTEIGAGDIEREFPSTRTTFVALNPTATLLCSNEVVGGSRCARYVDPTEEARRINDQGLDYSLPPQRLQYDAGIALAAPYDQLTGIYQVNPWPRTQNPVGQMVTPSAYSNTNIDLRGKAGNTGIYASVSNLTQQGAIRFLNGFQRNSARINLDHTFSDRLSASITSYYSQGREDAAHLDQTTGGLWFGISRMPWFVNLTARDQLGRLYIRPNILNQGDQNGNPLYTAQNNRRMDRSTRFVGGTTIRYSPLRWLNLDGNFSYDRATGIFTQTRDRGYRTTTPDPGFSGGFIGEGSSDNDAFNTSLNATARFHPFRDFQATFTSRGVYSQSKSISQSFLGTELVVPGLETADAATQNYAIGSGKATIREMGFFTGADFELKERYILSALLRRDGSSLFGAGNRWATFGRISAAWIASREPWWFVDPVFSLFKVRASHGTTGQRPSFSAQYETFTIGTGGTLNPATAGNRNLKPEINTETEIGVDTEIFDRFGLTVTYARSNIDQQILPVRAPTATGFQTQWQNAGELENRTWEAALTIPIINRRDFSWSSRVIWDRTRSEIVRLDAPEFVGVYHPAAFGFNPFPIFKFRQGEQLGTFYGTDYVRNCSQLPVPFQSQCGSANSAFRPNEAGYIVWVGQGNQLTEGITRNLWRTNLPQAATNCGATCPTTVGPWGARAVWGMPIVLRDSVGGVQNVALGNGIPDYHIGFSQNLSYKRFTAYALLDGAFGQEVWNIGYHWSLGDFMSAEQNQTGKSVEEAKPIGYYWRRGPAQVSGSSGVGGFYDVLNPTRFSVEDGSYMKLREVTLNYRVGPVGGVGNWTVGVIGRNLKTWTDFRGFDPEVGVGDASGRTGPLNSAALTAVAGFRFPNLRTYTLQLSTSF